MQGLLVTRAWSQSYSCFLFFFVFFFLFFQSSLEIYQDINSSTSGEVILQKLRSQCLPHVACLREIWLLLNEWNDAGFCVHLNLLPCTDAVLWYCSSRGSSVLSSLYIPQNYADTVPAVLVPASWNEGLPRWLSGKESACQCWRRQFNPWVRKIPWRKKCQPTPVFLPGKSHGQRTMAGYSPWVRKKVGHNWAAKTTSWN